MSMNTGIQEIDDLLKRYAIGQLDRAEFTNALELLRDGNNDPHIDAVMSEDWEAMEMHYPYTEEAKEQLYAQIVGHPRFTGQNLPTSKTPTSKMILLWPRVVAAAVAIVIFGAGLFYYNYRISGKPDQTRTDLANDVPPGKQGATLTLASGQKIRLSGAANGELAKEAGVTITKSAEGQLIYELKGSDGESKKINTLSTSNGETYQVRLPDGSTVYLNSASSLTYSAGLLKDGKRSVRLSGEGYFSVAKDKSHPFVVETRGQSVEVLGTEFNLNAYEDEAAIATTLLEGVVKVSAGDNLKMLKPGQQSINDQRLVRVQQADLENIVAWKDGDFNFEGEQIESIMRKLQRWYNIEVVYSGAVPQQQFYGKISRNQNISAVLDLLQETHSVHFKIEGRRVTVTE